MKKFTISILLLYTSVCIKAQDYLINFTGSGQSTTVETVEVKNISQQTTLILSGSDILHLVDVVGINPVSEIKDRLLVYPNPINLSSRIEFYNTRTGDTRIEICDFTGKILTCTSSLLQQGNHIFKISGLCFGIYLVKVSTPEFIYMQRLISTSEIQTVPCLIYEGNTQGTLPQNHLRSINNIVDMQYNDGERLSFKGISSDYAHTITMVPTESQTIDFEFIECRDPAGRNYAVVTAGAQTWMAENLAYSSKINSASQISSAEPCYYVYGYNGTNVTEAKATEYYLDYGVLYNWAAAMTGCPAGWHLPSDNEWSNLTDFTGNINPDNIGNQLKSCRQMDSPLGGDCNTYIHPRWDVDSYNGNYGTDNVGFSCLPGGRKPGSGATEWIGEMGFWWSSTELYGSEAYVRYLAYNTSVVYSPYFNKTYGLSVRCVRD
jgi:uncharacterized protein (TIGR02145 family)